MFERVRARKTEKGVAVFMRAYGIQFDAQVLRLLPKKQVMQIQIVHGFLVLGSGF
jgi:hypothetical protein